MGSEIISISGLSLMFVLGLRHGFDPDHIAIIDSMAFRSLAVRPRMAPWIGTLFALGHGLAVTMIAVLLGAYASGLSLPARLGVVLGWLPIALLILVGTLNLRDLLGGRDYRAIGWKTAFVPKRLRNSSHPLAIFSIGIVFAMVFDTATQAAAWGYAASAHSGMSMALWVGLVFTAGMVISDTLDGRLMVRLLRLASRSADALDYRRKVGWMIVALSYGIALYCIAKQLFPDMELSDAMTTAAGFTLFLVLLLGYVWFARRRSISSLPIAQE